MAIVAVICGTALAPSLFGQSLNGYFISDYETLEWLFETGQIDSDEYERWNEYFTDSLHETLNGDTLAFSTESAQRVARESAKEKRRSSFSYRMYHRGEEDRPYRQLIQLRSVSDSGLYGSVSVERYADQIACLRTRHIGWTDGRTNLQAGGVDPVWCGGLVAGRHSYFLKEKEPSGSLLFSMRDRFNGVLAEREIGDATVSAFSSFDRDSVFNASAQGACLSLDRKFCHVEVAAISGRIRNRHSGRTKGVSAVGLEGGCRAFGMRATADLAADGGGAVACLGQITDESAKNRLYIWHYDDAFLNPFGAGRANTDTREVSINEIGLKYRSRFAGETGVQTVSSVPLGHSHRLTLESNWWRTEACEKYRLKGTYSCAVTDSYRIRLMAITGDDSLRSTGYGLWSAAIGCDTDVTTTDRLSLSARAGSSRTASIRKEFHWIDARWSRRLPHHRSIFLARYFDPSRELPLDHYVYVSARESYALDCGLEFSLNITTRFGPEQDATKKARITFESEWRL